MTISPLQLWLSSHSAVEAVELAATKSIYLLDDLLLAIEVQVFVRRAVARAIVAELESCGVFAATSLKLSEK